MRSSSIVESVTISTMWKIAQYDFDLAAMVSAPGMQFSPVQGSSPVRVCCSKYWTCVRNVLTTNLTGCFSADVVIA